MLRKNSIIKDWGFSYVLILLIPLITVFINYGFNMKTIRKEIVQAHELILDNLKDNIDLLLQEEREMFSFFHLNQEFRDMVYAQEMDNDFYRVATNFYNDLKAYGISNDNISYWLYMEDKDYIISSNGGNSSYNIYVSEELKYKCIPKYDSWKSFLSGTYQNDFLFYKGLYTRKEETSLVYANSYFNYDDNKANIFITMPISAIRQFTDSLPEGSLLVMYIDTGSEDLEKKLLVLDAKGSAKLPGSVDVSIFSDGDSMFEVKDYIGISETSNVAKITYSLLVPQNTFWRESKYIRNVHLVSLLITLIVGFGVVVFSLKRNFRPMSSLLDFIGSTDKENNEFKQLEAIYSKMLHENKSMKKTMQIQEKSLVSSYLLSLLKGRIIKPDNKDPNKPSSISLECEGYALVGIYIPPQDDIKNEDLSFFVIDNIFSELMEEENFYFIEDGRFLFYLFCLEKCNVVKWKENCLKSAEFLYELLEDKFNLSLSIAISDVEQDWGQAKHVYKSVMEAFEYKQIIGGGGVITTEELYDSEENSQLHVYHVMLKNALENGRKEEALDVSEQLFRNMANMSLLVQRLKIFEAFQVIAESYNSFITDEVKRMQLLTWLNTILNANDVQTLKEQFQGVLVFACTKMSGQWEVEKKGFAKLMQEYVDTHYTDSNLNLNLLAEKMNKNPKYVSRIFKEETGEGISDYINNLRIKKAQEIMITESKTIEEVGALVGYGSPRTFRRIFTKIVGMPPSSYLEKN